MWADSGGYLVTISSSHKIYQYNSVSMGGHTSSSLVHDLKINMD